MIAAATILSGACSAFAAPNKAFSALANHDYATAYKEFKILADQGDAPSQYNLAVMCKNGKGMPPNYTEAFKWYRMAADQGHVKAQFNVARMYYEGQGVKQDYLLASMWAELAGMHGDAEALKLKDTVAHLITPAQLAEAQRMAREWKPATK
jgi:TPR repeat protein